MSTGVMKQEDLMTLNLIIYQESHTKFAFQPPQTVAQQSYYEVKIQIGCNSLYQLSSLELSGLFFITPVNIDKNECSVHL